MPEKSRLRKNISRWASHSREEARELRKESQGSGLIQIKDAPDREKVLLQGVVKSITLRPRGGVPAVEAELYDGSGRISLVFLGRRRIAGIAPGTVLRIEGRIGLQGEQRVMFNPRYELRG